MDSLAGKSIKGYELRQLIGQGGFGAIYRASQPAVGREVAIKVILPQYANHPDFIRRFEAEAQLVARLEHINIVPLYDYWREPNGAFLVMRWLKGGSLRGALKKGPWPADKAAKLLEQIAAALAQAHRNGIVHRDIKPDNILLDEEGNAYLADFGIAKDISTHGDTSRDGGDISGSTEYFSPEQIRSTRLTAQTDIYSLGVVMYEILTGAKPFPATNVTQLLQKSLHEPLPPLYEMAPDLPDQVNDVIQRATAKDPADRYTDVMQMAAAFRQALTEDTSGPGANVLLVPDEQVEEDEGLEITNPYKGLRAFQESDASDFFGREALTDQLMERLAETDQIARFLAVVGPSGSGKSSAVKAGLLPALRNGGLPDSKSWYIVEMLPGAYPLEKLVEALNRVATNPTPTMLDELQKDKGGLQRVIAQILPDEQSELLLVIDQFEEVFTQVEDEATRKLFLDSLMSAVNSKNSRLRVVVTLRADFYDRPLLYLGFGDLMRKRTEVVIPLSPEELERAIIGPADRVGLRLEPELIAAIIKDVGDQPGILPLLQYALTELFERRKGRLLTLQAYEESGGVSGALARRAEELYNDLDEAGQAATRQLFLRLVTLGEGVEDTRRRIRVSEISSLMGSSNQNNKLMAVIDDFSKYRLLTFDRDPVTRGPTVEVAHEALIRTWKRLREWLAVSRADLRLQQRLTVASGEWLNSGRDRSFLLTGVRLAQYEAWTTGTTEIILNEEETEYLNASIAEHKAKEAAELARQQQELRLQRRAATFLRYLVIVMAISLVVAIILSGFAVTQGQAAVVSANTATVAQGQALINLNRSENLRLAVEANNQLQIGSNAEVASLLSIRSLSSLYTDQGNAALLRASTFDYSKLLLTGHTGTVFAVAISPDGSTIATGSSDSTARLWDAKTGKLIRTFTGHTDAIYDIAFSPDGKWLFSGSRDQTGLMWDVATGATVRKFTGPAFKIWSIAYSPDGKYVAGGFGSGQVDIWDANTGAVVHELKGHTDYVPSMAFSPDSQYLITGSGDNTARLWNVATGDLVQKFVGHTNVVKGVAVTANDKSVITGSWDKSVAMWDVASGKPTIQFVGHTDKVYEVRISPDGQYVLTASEDKTARLWDIKTGNEVERFANHTQGVRSARFSTDGSEIVTGSSDNTARLWDVHHGTKPGVFVGHAGAVASVAYSPDGKLVLTGAEDKTARLWDAATGKQLQIFTEHQKTNGNVVSIVFSPDGTMALTGGDDKFAWLWDIKTGKGIYRFEGQTDWIGQVGFSPDGKMIMTSSRDKTVRLWDSTTYALIKTLTLTSPVYGAAFSPDGKTILTGTDDGGVILWDVASGKQIRQFVGHKSQVFRVAFSPDGKYILTSSTDGTVGLWDVTGTLLHSFPGHPTSSPAAWVAFSPDGRLIATSGYGSSAALWDAQTFAKLREFPSTGTMRSVVFSPDGRYVLTGSSDTTAQLWLTDYHSLIATMCDSMQRDFTASERKTYTINDNEPTCAKFGTQTIKLGPTWTPIPMGVAPSAPVAVPEPTSEDF